MRAPALSIGIESEFSILFWFDMIFVDRYLIVMFFVIFEDITSNS